MSSLRRNPGRAHWRKIMKVYILMHHPIKADPDDESDDPEILKQGYTSKEEAEKGKIEEAADWYLMFSFNKFPGEADYYEGDCPTTIEESDKYFESQGDQM